MATTFSSQSMNQPHASVSHDEHYEHGDSHHVGFFKTYIWSHDHKMIALQYFWTSLVFLFIGGLLALGMRWQIGFPNTPLPLLSYILPVDVISDDGFFQPKFYNAMVTMHATVMVFWFVMPVLIGVFGNYLIPLKIGARDMAFPFFNELSFWVFFLSGIILMASFFVEGGAANTGWTAYVPLASFGPYSGAPMGQNLWCLAIFVNGVASLIGAFNYITTIIHMRAPGMTMFRLPLSVWGLFVTAIILLLAVPVLAAAAILLLLDLNFGTAFYNPALGGQPLLWQHLFWFFGHPEVYIMILPAMGMASDILATFSRKPIFGYKAMVIAIIAIALLGFIVWAHHMFVSGMSPYLSMVFSISTMVIATPSAIKTFNWLGTIWGGSIHFTTPMLFALAFVSLFVIGGLSGIFLASTPVNIFVHNTYFVVAHFHYVLFGGSIFAIFAAIYYWFPKMFGRMMGETLGNVHFVLTFIFFNCTFFPMHNLGIGGMMRRIADPTLYEHLANLQPINQFVTFSAIGLGLSQFVFVWNLIDSIRNGEKAGRNPWRANTLEWITASPPGHGNFEGPIPTVYHGPYEFSVPGLKEDFLLQTDPTPLPKEAKSH